MREGRGLSSYTRSNTLCDHTVRTHEKIVCLGISRRMLHIRMCAYLCRCNSRRLFGAMRQMRLETGLCVELD